MLKKIGLGFLGLAMGFAAVLFLLSGPVHAKDGFAQSHPVGYRVSVFNGVRAAVWYPSKGKVSDHDYGGGFMGRVVPGGDPGQGDGPFPLVLFSHGLAGCGTQSIFFTEELARRGYVVVAPDHRDALCRSDGGKPVLSAGKQPSILDPSTWNEKSYADRRDDIESILRALETDTVFSSVIDFSRIGIAGHSVGGYTALGLAGAWPTWKNPRIKAVLAFSPYTLPFTIAKTLKDVTVPVMYQGADFDFGITPFLEGGQGAYTQTNAPKYFVKLRGGNHFIWTNLQCLGTASVSACGQTKPEAALINAYGISFFDKTLKGIRQPLLKKRFTKLSRYEFKE